MLRAGMGAHFRLPIISSLDWETVPNYLLPDTYVHIADCTMEPSLRAREEPAVLIKADWPYDQKARRARASHESDTDSPEAEEPVLLGAQHYHEPWMELPVALVIGGETHGVSAEAERLADSSGGRRLVIPVVPEVESLNAAMAASILLFEAKRQLHRGEETGSHEEREGHRRPRLQSIQHLLGE